MSQYSLQYTACWIGIFGQGKTAGNKVGVPAQIMNQFLKQQPWATGWAATSTGTYVERRDLYV